MSGFDVTLCDIVSLNLTISYIVRHCELKMCHFLILCDIKRHNPAIFPTIPLYNKLNISPLTPRCPTTNGNSKAEPILNYCHNNATKRHIIVNLTPTAPHHPAAHTRPPAAARSARIRHRQPTPPQFPRKQNLRVP